MSARAAARRRRAYRAALNARQWRGRRINGAGRERSRGFQIATVIEWADGRRQASAAG